MGKAKLVICPYCGDTQPVSESCRTCEGDFGKLSRRATHNTMGPWFVRDSDRPHQPGCSYETIIEMIETGRIDRRTILRGPTTGQFWTLAKRVPGISHLFGACHACGTDVQKSATECQECGEVFGAYLDRNHLGLPEIEALPWEASFEVDPSRGGTLSAFGSNEELTTTITEPSQEPNKPTIVQDAIKGTAVSTAGQVDSDAARRALLFRIERQQRTIRLLMVVVVLLMIGAVAAIVMIRGQESDSEGLVASPVSSDMAEDVDPVINRESAPEALDQSGPDSVVESPTQEPDQAPASGFVASPADDPLAAVADMERLAADNAQTPERRVELYEQVIAALGAIAESETDGDRRDSLLRRIANAERELERLRLRSFFDDQG